MRPPHLWLLRSSDQAAHTWSPSRWRLQVANLQAILQSSSPAHLDRQCNDFSFPSAVAQLSEVPAYRRDSGTGSYSDVANHRSAISPAYVTIFSCPSPSEDPLISRLIPAIKKKTPPLPRYPIDEPAWDPSVIIEHWLSRPDNDELSIGELALKSWSLWGVATWPRPSDGSKLVRSTLRRDPPVWQACLSVVRY